MFGSRSAHSIYPELSYQINSSTTPQTPQVNCHKAYILLPLGSYPQAYNMYQGQKFCKNFPQLADVSFVLFISFMYAAISTVLSMHILARLNSIPSVVSKSIS